MLCISRVLRFFFFHLKLKKQSFSLNLCDIMFATFFLLKLWETGSQTLREKVMLETMFL